MSQNSFVQILLLRRKLQREQQKTQQLEQELWDTRQELEFRLALADEDEKDSTPTRRVRFQSSCSSLALSDVGQDDVQDEDPGPRRSLFSRRSFSRSFSRNFSRSGSGLGSLRSRASFRPRRTVRNSTTVLDVTATDEISRLEAENEDLRARISRLESGKLDEDEDEMQSAAGLSDISEDESEAADAEDEQLGVDLSMVVEERFALNRWERLTLVLMQHQEDQAVSERALERQHNLQLQKQIHELQKTIERIQNEQKKAEVEAAASQAEVASAQEHFRKKRAGLMERVEVAEQKCEKKEEQIKCLRDELEQYQLETSQAFMKASSPRPLDFVELDQDLPTLVIPDSAPGTLSPRMGISLSPRLSSEPELSKAVAAQIRRNLVLQRRMTGLLNWRSETTVGKLQTDLIAAGSPELLGRSEWMAPEVQESLLQLRSELEAERRKGTEEAEEYEDHITRLEEKLTQLRAAKSQSPPKSPSRSRASARGFGEKLAEIHRERESRSSLATPVAVVGSAGSTLSSSTQPGSAVMISDDFEAIDSRVAATRLSYQAEQNELLRKAAEATNDAEVLLSEHLEERTQLREQLGQLEAACANLKETHAEELCSQRAAYDTLHQRFQRQGVDLQEASAEHMLQNAAESAERQMENDRLSRQEMKLESELLKSREEAATLKSMHQAEVRKSEVHLQEVEQRASEAERSMALVESECSTLSRRLEAKLRESHDFAKLELLHEDRLEEQAQQWQKHQEIMAMSEKAKVACEEELMQYKSLFEGLRTTEMQRRQRLEAEKEELQHTMEEVEKSEAKYRNQLAEAVAKLEAKEKEANLAAMQPKSSTSASIDSIGPLPASTDVISREEGPTLADRVAVLMQRNVNLQRQMAGLLEQHIEAEARVPRHEASSSQAVESNPPDENRQKSRPSRTRKSLRFFGQQVLLERQNRRGVSSDDPGPSRHDSSDASPVSQQEPPRPVESAASVALRTFSIMAQREAEELEKLWREMQDVSARELAEERAKSLALTQQLQQWHQGDEAPGHGRSMRAQMLESAQEKHRLEKDKQELHRRIQMLEDVAKEKGALEKEREELKNRVQTLETAEKEKHGLEKDKQDLHRRIQMLEDVEQEKLALEKEREELKNHVQMLESAKQEKSGLEKDKQELLQLHRQAEAELGKLRGQYHSSEEVAKQEAQNSEILRVELQATKDSLLHLREKMLKEAESFKRTSEKEMEVQVHYEAALSRKSPKIEELQELLFDQELAKEELQHECQSLVQGEAQEFQLASEMQKSFAQELSQEQRACRQLQQEVSLKGPATLDNQQAIQGLEMLAESQEELGSLLEAQAARQRQAKNQHHEMEELREEYKLLLQREAEKFQLASEMQKNYAQELSQEQQACRQLRQEVSLQGLATLDSQQAIQGLEMLAESQEELGGLLEAQAARQRQAKNQHHEMEELREEYQLLMQREAEEFQLASEMQKNYAQELAREQHACRQLRREVSLQGLATLDNQQAIQGLEMLAESQDELGSLLEAQAARQLQARQQQRMTEGLREELRQKEMAMQSISQRIDFYKQGWLAEETQVQRVQGQLAKWQEEHQSALEQKKSTNLEEQAAWTYQVELSAAQDDVRKLKKSLVDMSVQRSEASAQQRQEVKEARLREEELGRRAFQLELRCKAQDHQLEIARLSSHRKVEPESEDTDSALEAMCERIREDCYRELEVIELSTALAQQETSELKESQWQMEMDHDVLREEVGQWRSEGLEAQELSQQLSRLKTELAVAAGEREGRAQASEAAEQADLATALHLELSAMKEEMWQLEQQSVADADAAQRSQRTIAALRTQNEKLKHRYDEVRLAESEATAMAIDLELQSSREAGTESMAFDEANLQHISEQAAAARSHLERAAAAESIAHARAAELSEQKELLRQECKRLREQNVMLVRQMHEGLTATALQDIKIVAAARNG